MFFISIIYFVLSPYIFLSSILYIFFISLTSDNNVDGRAFIYIFLIQHFSSFIMLCNTITQGSNQFLRIIISITVLTTIIVSIMLSTIFKGRFFSIVFYSILFIVAYLSPFYPIITTKF